MKILPIWIHIIIFIIGVTLAHYIILPYMRGEFTSKPDASTLWEVYEDEERDNICYIYKDESISCLPTKDLTK